MKLPNLELQPQGISYREREKKAETPNLLNSKKGRGGGWGWWWGGGGGGGGPLARPG